MDLLDPWCQEFAEAFAYIADACGEESNDTYYHDDHLAQLHISTTSYSWWHSMRKGIWPVPHLKTRSKMICISAVEQ